MQTKEDTINLADVVCTIPQLAQACIAALQDTTCKPGAGIKTLRLLCKSSRVAMFNHIQGFTFQLEWDASSEHILALIRFAKASKLSRLGLTLMPLPPNPPTPEQTRLLQQSAETGLQCANGNYPMPGDCGHRPSTADNTAHFSQQVERVLSGMGKFALQLITKLELDVQDIRGNNEHCTHFDIHEIHPTTLAEVFLPVATACPSVKHLRIAGSVGRAVIAELGATSKELASLEVVCIDVPLVSLERMHLLLPHLTHLKLLKPQRVLPRNALLDRLSINNDRISCKYASALIEQCFECRFLTNLEAPWVQEDCHCLIPPALQHASLAMYLYQGFRNPRAHWKERASLQSLVVNVQTDGMDLHHMGRLVMQAPRLTSLHVIGARVMTSNHDWEHSDGDDAQSLICLGSRFQQGLTLTAANAEGVPKDVILALSARYANLQGLGFEAPPPSAETSSLEDIFLQLSTLVITMFHGLCLTSAVTGHSFHLIPRIFPSIASLTLLHCEIDDVELASLGSLSLLHHLRFTNCKLLTMTAVRDLCLRLPALKLLTCNACATINRYDALSLKEALGERVKVEHTDS